MYLEVISGQSWQSRKISINNFSIFQNEQGQNIAKVVFVLKNPYAPLESRTILKSVDYKVKSFNFYENDVKTVILETDGELGGIDPLYEYVDINGYDVVENITNIDILKIKY